MSKDTPAEEVNKAQEEAEKYAKNYFTNGQEPQTSFEKRHNTAIANHFIAGAKWQASFPDAGKEQEAGCGICGGKLVLIRGRYPKEEKRLVCPTCNTERLEQINEISSKTYGQVYKNISND